MSLCERPTHWLPQNPLSFIINKLLLIIQALLNTMHILYMKGGEEGRKRQKQAGEKEKKDTVRRKNGWNERQSGDVGFAIEDRKKERFWAIGRRG